MAAPFVVVHGIRLRSRVGSKEVVDLEKGQDILSILELTEIGSKRIDDEHRRILKLLESIIGQLGDPSHTNTLFDMLVELEGVWKTHTETVVGPH